MIEVHTIPIPKSIEEATASGYGKIVSLLESYGVRKSRAKRSFSTHSLSKLQAPGTINELKELCQKAHMHNEKNVLMGRQL